MFVVAFYRKGPKCTFTVKNQHFFADLGKKVRLNLRGGISSERPKMYI